MSSAPVNVRFDVQGSDRVSSEIRKIEKDLGALRTASGTLVSTVKQMEGGFRQDAFAGFSASATAAATKATGLRTQLSQFGSTLAQNATSFGVATASVWGIYNAYDSLEKVQIRAHAAAQRVATLETTIATLTERRRQAVEKGNLSAEQMAILDDRITNAHNKLAVAQERNADLQQDVNEAWAGFVSQVGPQIIAAGASIVQLVTNISGSLTGVVPAIKGFFSAFVGGAPVITQVSDATLRSSTVLQNYTVSADKAKVATTGLSTAMKGLGAAALGGAGALIIIETVQAMQKNMDEAGLKFTKLSHGLLSGTDEINRGFSELDETLKKTHQSILQIMVDPQGAVKAWKAAGGAVDEFGNIVFETSKHAADFAGSYSKAFEEVAASGEKFLRDPNFLLLPKDLQTRLAKNIKTFTDAINNPDNWKNADYTKTSTAILLGLAHAIDKDKAKAQVYFRNFFGQILINAQAEAEKAKPIMNEIINFMMEPGDFRASREKISKLIDSTFGTFGEDAATRIENNQANNSKLVADALEKTLLQSLDPTQYKDLKAGKEVLMSSLFNLKDIDVGDAEVKDGIEQTIQNGINEAKVDAAKKPLIDKMRETLYQSSHDPALTEELKNDMAETLGSGLIGAVAKMQDTMDKSFQDITGGLRDPDLKKKVEDDYKALLEQFPNLTADAVKKSAEAWASFVPKFNAKDLDLAKILGLDKNIDADKMFKNLVNDLPKSLEKRFKSGLKFDLKMEATDTTVQNYIAGLIDAVEGSPGEFTWDPKLQIDKHPENAIQYAKNLVKFIDKQTSEEELLTNPDLKDLRDELKAAIDRGASESEIKEILQKHVHDAPAIHVIVDNLNNQMTTDLQKQADDNPIKVTAQIDTMSDKDWKKIMKMPYNQPEQYYISGYNKSGNPIYKHKSDQYSYDSKGRMLDTNGNPIGDFQDSDTSRFKIPPNIDQPQLHGKTPLSDSIPGGRPGDLLRTSFTTPTGGAGLPGLDTMNRQINQVIANIAMLASKWSAAMNSMGANAASGSKQILTNLGGGFIKIGGAIDMIATGWSSTMNSFGANAKSGGAQVIAGLGGAFIKIGGAIDMLATGWSKVMNSFGANAKSGGSQVITGLGGSLIKIGGAIDLLAHGWSVTMNSFGANAKSGGSQIISGLGGALIKIGGAIDMLEAGFAAAMKRMVSSAKSAASSINSSLQGIKDVDVTVHVGLSGAGVPYLGKKAVGFHGMITEPTLMMVGEAGPEMVTVTPQNKIRERTSYGGEGGGGGGPTVIHIEMPVYLGNQLLTKIIKDLPLSDTGMFASA